ncbi:MAG: hypothetical protein QGI45_17335 [Myxococcota bacterium]|jgi:hypothetical protein|nr:hypothetical protein [Myxococcota bacterium]
MFLRDGLTCVFLVMALSACPFGFLFDGGPDDDGDDWDMDMVMPDEICVGFKSTCPQGMPGCDTCNRCSSCDATCGGYCQDWGDSLAACGPNTCLNCVPGRKLVKAAAACEGNCAGQCITQTLTGSFEIRNALDIAVLNEYNVLTGNLSMVEAVGIKTLALPGLTQIGGSLQISANPDLESVDFTLLETVGGALNISENPKLPTCQVQALQEQVCTEPSSDTGEDTATGESEETEVSCTSIVVEGNDAQASCEET